MSLRTWLASGVIAVALSVATQGEAIAQTGCTFALGFKAIREAIPRTVGDCLENEHHNPENGDALQQTNGGLLVWRKLDNFTAFTDGYRSWVNGPQGIQVRLNTEMFDWELWARKYAVVMEALKFILEGDIITPLRRTALGAVCGAANMSGVGVLTCYKMIQEDLVEHEKNKGRMTSSQQARFEKLKELFRDAKLDEGSTATQPAPPAPPPPPRAAPPAVAAAPAAPPRPSPTGPPPTPRPTSALCTKDLAFDPPCLRAIGNLNIYRSNRSTAGVESDIRMETRNRDELAFEVRIFTVLARTTTRAEQVEMRKAEVVKLLQEMGFDVRSAIFNWSIINL